MIHRNFRAREYSRALQPKFARQPNFSRRRGAARVVALVFLGIIALGAGAFWKWQSDREYQRKWGDILMPERVARVMQSTDAASLGKLLKSTGKVRDAAAFDEAARDIKLGEIKAGGYLLPPKAGPRVLAKVFSAGPTLEKVTFPEGWTALHMAKRLQREGFAGAAAFRAAAYPSGKFSAVEGKLFPETYYLPLKGSAAELMQPLQERFAEVMNGLPRAATFPAVNGKRLTQNEVVILASLVERETSVASERPLIAGVLLQRLRQKMRLQCDASVQYARERAAASGQLPQGHKARLFFSDLKIDSPFNTYLHAGLPPTPICNPGKDALHAAAAPQNTDKIFYVMSPKLGHHLFAVTFAEHGRNIRIVKAERAP